MHATRQFADCKVPAHRSNAIADQTFFLSDGVPVTIRPVQPEDCQLFDAFTRTVSASSRYQRFFSMREFSPDEVTGFSSIDPTRDAALIATVQTASGEQEVGVVRYAQDRVTGRHDMALLVADAWQGRGLGKRLLEQLIALAAQKGVAAMDGVVLSTNHRMLRLVRQLGFSVHRDPGDATVTSVTRVIEPNASHWGPSRWPSLV